MILTIDIGKTNITLGGFDGDKLAFVARLSTNTAQTADEYAGKISATLGLYRVEPTAVRGAILSSVVPPLNAAVREAIRFICGVDALVVGPGIKTGLNIHCDHPASVGSDLICACVAAQQLYGSPALIVDMGTVTKMMVIDRRGTFIGVSFMPGAAMGLRALSDGTAQLPQVSLEPPGGLLGKNTADCMRSGAVYGNASMIDGMIDRFREELGEELPVYATGGLASAVVPYCRHEIRLDEHLILRGLYLLYQKNNK